MKLPFKSSIGSLLRLWNHGMFSFISFHDPYNLMSLGKGWLSGNASCSLFFMLLAIASLRVCYLDYYKSYFFFPPVLPLCLPLFTQQAKLLSFILFSFSFIFEMSRIAVSSISFYRGDTNLLLYQPNVSEFLASALVIFTGHESSRHSQRCWNCIQGLLIAKQ